MGWLIKKQYIRNMTDNCTAANANKVFDLVVATYHEHDDVDAKVETRMKTARLNILFLPSAG